MTGPGSLHGQPQTSTYQQLERRSANYLRRACHNLLGPKLACYAAIIALYEEGDRIFLSGFSRGADTVRSVAGVMTYCGVPRHMPDGSPPAPRPKDHPQARRARCQGCSIVPIVLAQHCWTSPIPAGDARRYRRPI